MFSPSLNALLVRAMRAPASVEGDVCADVVVAPYPPMMEHKVSSPTKSLEGMGAGVPVVGSAEVDEHITMAACARATRRRDTIESFRR